MRQMKRSSVYCYAAKEGIQLDPRQIVKNPGLKALAKLMLNSFWGKYTKRKTEERHLYFINLSFLILRKFAHPNMTKVTIISYPAEYFDLLSSDQINVSDANFINDELIEVHYVNVDKFVEADAKNQCSDCSFHNCACLPAYCVLEQLDCQVLYFDMDLMIYVSKDGEWELPTRSYLRELTDEPDGNHIITFVSGDQKNYAYETNTRKTVCKV